LKETEEKERSSGDWVVMDAKGKLPAEGWEAHLEEILKTPRYIEFLQFCEARIARAEFERAAYRLLLLESPPTELLQ
jgi:hypothetical protein